MQPLQQRGVPFSERELWTGRDSRLGSDPNISLRLRGAAAFVRRRITLVFRSMSLRRRISDLEQQLGVTLLTRHVDGVRTTAEGEEILAAAREMELASFSLVRARDRRLRAMVGEVRLAVTEGLGTFWLAPRLIEFQRAHPKLLVDLNCAMQSADVLRLEADAAVQLTKPTNPDLKIVKLGRLHSMPFASQSYIDTYGRQKTLEQLFKHRVVLQVAEQTAMQEIYDRVAPGVPQVGFVSLANQCEQRSLLGNRERRGNWLATDLCHALQCARGADRSRSTFHIRYLAYLSSRRAIGSLVCGE